MRRKRRLTGLERRGDGYRVRIRIGGKRESVTAATTDRRTAIALIEQRIAELERDAEWERVSAALGQVTKRRMRELFQWFEETHVPALAPGAQASYRDSLRPLRAYFVDTIDNPLADSIEGRHVDDYLAWRRVHWLGAERKLKNTPKATGDTAQPAEKPAPRPVSNRTLAKDRAVLHRVFRLAKKRREVTHNPVTDTEKPKADPRNPVILSDDQFEALLKAIGDRPMLKLYALMLNETGMRCESEVLWLHWGDVSFDGGSITVVSGRGGHWTKSGKGRVVPMTPRLVAALREHFARFRFNVADSPWIFFHQFTGRRFSTGARIASLREGFHAAARRAKLPLEFRQHDLRHRRVTTWLAAEKSPVKVMKALGHSDLKVTMGYYSFVSDDLKSLVESCPTPQHLRETASSA